MDRLSPDLLDRLAADYVFGSLTAATRRRFQAVIQQSAEAAEAVRAWERRIATLAGTVTPLPPSTGLWERVEQGAQASLARRNAAAINASLRK